MKKAVFGFVLLFVSVLFACDSPQDAPYTKQCRKIEDNLSVCRNFARDEGEAYAASCIKRGNKVIAAEEHCGKLWGDAYTCVAELSCEDFEAWRTTRKDGSVDFPCLEEQQAFLSECPDLPLWSSK